MILPRLKQNNGLDSSSLVMTEIYSQGITDKVTSQLVTLHAMHKQ